MQRALRRVLWIIPTLLALSLLGFGAITSSLHTAQGQARFFNPDPVHPRRLAEDAMRSVAQGGPGAAASVRELVTLGGAALPSVLPLLDTLSPVERARVAVALGPIGQRMGVGDADELKDPEQAVVFWTRFWQDRALDFRERVAARAVSRLAQKGSALRQSDVLALDTFALPELIRQLDARSPLERTERLTAALAHITQLGWTLPPHATEQDAQALIRSYRAWWSQHRARYTPREGGERVVAMVRDTQYGDWLVSTVLERPEQLVTELGAAATPTLRLALTGLLGAWALSLTLLLTVPGTRLSWRWLTVAALPLMGVVMLGASEHLATALVALYGALRAFLVTRAAAATHLPRDTPVFEAALGLPPWRQLLRRVRAGASYLTADLPSALPGLFSACLVIELGTSRPGLARRTLAALGDQDVGFLMGLLLALTTVVCLTQIVSDALLGWLDPRLKSGVEL